jgi:hypothetical protein
MKTRVMAMSVVALMVASTQAMAIPPAYLSIWAPTPQECTGDDSKRRAEQRSAFRLGVACRVSGDSASWPLACLGRLIAGTRPVAWIHSTGYAATNRRVGPIRRMLDLTVLDRIEMDVIEMAG